MLRITKLRPDSTRENVGKAIKYEFAFCAARDSGEKWTSDSVSNLKHFIHVVRFRWPNPKFHWPPKFPSFSCGPLEICAPADHVAHLENRWLSQIFRNTSAYRMTPVCLLLWHCVWIKSLAAPLLWVKISCLHLLTQLVRASACACVTWELRQAIKNSE
jgi:hypothetical protein